MSKNKSDETVAYLFEINKRIKDLNNRITSIENSSGSKPSLTPRAGKGGTFGLVFDTDEQMAEYLAYEEHLKSMRIGQSISIKQTDVPDYSDSRTEI
jgi:hypothetical protein